MAAYSRIYRSLFCLPISGREGYKDISLLRDERQDQAVDKDIQPKITDVSFLRGLVVCHWHVLFYARHFFLFSTARRIRPLGFKIIHGPTRWRRQEEERFERWWGRRILEHKLVSSRHIRPSQRPQAELFSRGKMQKLHIRRWVYPNLGQKTSVCSYSFYSICHIHHIRHIHHIHHICRLFVVFFCIILLIVLRGGELERKWRGKSAQEIFLEKKWIEVVLDEEENGKKNSQGGWAGQMNTLLMYPICSNPLSFAEISWTAPNDAAKRKNSFATELLKRKKELLSSPSKENAGEGTSASAERWLFA